MENLPAINRSLTQRTTLSPEQRSSIAKAILSTSRPNATEASKAAKKLTGQFANLKPDNPQQFIASVAAVLAQYPLGLIDECTNEVTGLAVKIEFLSLKSLTAWMNTRLETNQAIARYQPPRLAVPELPDNPEMAERIAGMLVELAAELRTSNTRSPLDQMLQERADGRRLRIEEILRMANEPAAQQSAEAAE